VSYTLLKIIPADRRHLPPAETHEPALDLLAELTQGSEPEVRVFDRVQFIDPGENIEAMICPRCGNRLAMNWTPEHTAYFEWYGDIVEEEESVGADFYNVVTPCCRQSVPFADLQFVEGGFAMFELQVMDPEIDYPMSGEMQSKVEAALGCPVKQVWARY
jgi:hypothetical protein